MLHSATCLKTCHFTACSTSLWTSISIFNVNTARDVVTVLLISSKYLSFYLHLLTCSYTDDDTEAHTHKHTCIISTQEEWRQTGTEAWLKEAEERLLPETKKGLPHQKKRGGGENVTKETIFTNLKKRIWTHRASSKATRPILTK